MKTVIDWVPLLKTMIDMTERYAELTLYAAVVPREAMRGRIPERSLVKAYVKSGSVLQLCGFDRFVETNEQAEELIAFAKEHIPRASDFITLDGADRFYRKIRVWGAEEKDKEKLVAKLKESGYVPKDWEVERHPWMHSLDGTADEKRQKIRGREGIDPDRPWYTALWFYDENGNKIGADPDDIDDSCLDHSD